jgi:hypothetical protein
VVKKEKQFESGRVGASMKWKHQDQLHYFFAGSILLVLLFVLLLLPTEEAGMIVSHLRRTQLLGFVVATY